ncbi:Eco57I restriction-modification methylase domain-containing protein [Actinomadura rugatobispora]|uniref:site-specific DNA-methyltransferase (adenine-specific) n=1 Tax=Actinomadura rugatobispora TaxID=1994 RepID=A0ABW1ADJ1_9ACTN|nr:hypothetical protein GCM10010200_075930 [Actinomadura rugatobispora]
MPPRRKPKGPSITQQHAEWVRLLRPDGPFVSATVLASVFGQGLDTVPRPVLERVRQGWKEVQASPQVLLPAWYKLILSELLSCTDAAIAEGAALPEGLRAWSPTDRRARPDAVLYGPDGKGGRAERLLLYRRPWNEPLAKATKQASSPVEQAIDLCRRRATPLALLTNGRLWTLVHARPGEPPTVATFDADLWFEEDELLRAFATLLSARSVLPPATLPDGGGHSASLAALFARSAEKQAEVTDTLGEQVRDAVALLVGEMGRLDRESDGALLAYIPARDAYRGALTVMMRLVFLLYAEEARLVPVGTELYDHSYSVSGLFDLLEAERSRSGEGFGDTRAAAWPRLIATFRAVHAGSEHNALRIPPYGGGLFDPDRYDWLERLPVTDRVVHAILEALLILKQRGERLSYKGLDVEQIGHVYEGLLEYSCRRTTEPHISLIGALNATVPLADVEESSQGEDFDDWLGGKSGATQAKRRKGLAAEPDPDALGQLDAACDNDRELASRVRPFWGLLRPDLRGRPVVHPAGSLIIDKVGDRRATGTHYTPRSLAEEVVEHTLAPLCFSPGPAEGADRPSWSAKAAPELLKLKVLDPAMGSGAFLVSACRYLGDRVVEAWERDGLPDDVIEAVGPDFDRDDLLLEARRRVAAGCLYGVDRDEMAVELAKLSLWLVTLAKDKPFSFLDHALRCGDSLIGLTSEAQIENYHLDPQRGRYINNRTTGMISEVTGPLLTRVQELRERIEAQPVRDAEHGEELARLLGQAERLADRLRLASDAVVAAALSAAGDAKSNRRPHWEEQDEDASDLFEERLTQLADLVEKALEVDEDGYPTFDAEQAEKEARERITPMLKGTRPEPIRPLHWPLEFPEVMRRGGFNAVVGNPPFIGGQKLTGSVGDDVREFLVQWIARDKRGSADLCSYFLLRDLALAPSGRTGIIATNTIAQGDTREVGLDQATEWGWDIYHAIKSQPWPGTASLEVSLVWAGHAASGEKRILDGNEVPAITTSLDAVSRVVGNPYRLATNKEQAFQGSNVLGAGFIINPQQAEELIETDPHNKDVLFPYLNGEDLNQHWDSSARRWVINFHDWSEERATTYKEPFEIVERRVKPFRAQNKRKVRRERWWQYAERAPTLQEAIEGLDWVLTIALVSKTGLPVWQETGQVFSHMLGVFATQRDADFSLLSSAMHFIWWTTKGQSTLRTDARYTPSDGFETFPQPTLSESMDQAGESLHSFRREIMKQRRETHPGLTAIYNLVHNVSVQDEDIVRLREIHVEVDEAVREAYALDEEQEPEIREFEARIAAAPLPSWREIDLGHGFHETRQGVRFTISPQAQLDVLDKLLALNHYRYKQEERKGLHNKPRRKSSRKPARPATLKTTEDVGDGLFAPPDALF